VMADARQQKFDGSEARQDPGESVVLTLDEKIQYIAERETGSGYPESFTRRREA